ncbi:hypothetical protein MVEN_02011400 [Mycena venus]|uniref:Uncharacterized protein n=1 Tax=Mycena venus TaxID=2733690 RepID=A0A8H6XB99_9AGAR|nr:hypothetical protein MVEN_02011400 [Mycena venus]
MTTTIRVRFEGLGRDFRVKKWQIPNHSNSFHSIPADDAFLFVPAKKSLFVNRPGDRRPQAIGFDDAKSWGLHEDEYADLTFARASKKFCLRLLLNAERTTQDVHSETYRTYERLVADARFHSDHLADVEGLLAPVHCGMWLMDTGDWAGKVLFSISQYCGISWNELRFTKFNTEANRILVGRTFEALHDFGVDHGGLDSPSEFRHVIIDVYAPGLTKEAVMEGKAPCYMVGFSEARANHRCARRLPIVPLDTCPDREEVGCAEIRTVISFLKFLQRPSENTIVSQALEWHTKYSELYPDIENTYVLVAQRARFYSQFPKLYPELDVGFETEDPYCRVEITRDPFPGEFEEESQDGGVASTSAQPVLHGLEAAVDDLRLADFNDPPAVVAF